MQLNLIRHAKSIYNEKGLFQGQIDCPLSLKGIQDAKKEARNFPKDFDICFCSPLIRTKQTAQVLVPYLDIIFDERLKERALGDWEGNIITDEKRLLLKQRFVPPNGETFEILDKRINDFIDMIRDSYIKEKILIVTHGGIICTMCRILGAENVIVENLKMIKIEI